MDNSKKLMVLGLESSCDDTSAAVVQSGPRILSNIVITQTAEHAPYYGVVPEIAARSHMAHLEGAINSALREARVEFRDIDAIAATSGPGLIGGVIVSSMYGKALASALHKPFIAINHLEGHALTPKLSNPTEIDYPYLLLLVSGGHCQFVAVKALADYKILGLTLDDSVGEAFDKVAKMMGGGFPGGPIIEKAALLGDELRFNFPRPLYNSRDCDMSFSGLKTAVKLVINKLNPLREQDKADIAASFQHAVSDILTKKAINAIAAYEKICRAKNLVIAGGVASNLFIRGKLEALAHELDYNFVAPPIKLCTDNAAMIAFAGLERLKNGMVSDMGFRPRARWSLEEVSYKDI